MSNYLNDYGLTNEINLTISSFAYQIIIEDIKNFIYKVDKSNFSKFCSIIFLSYYKEANANFEERIEKEINSINEFIKTNNIKDKDTIIKFEYEYLNSKFKDELKMKKDKKDKSKKIYLDDEVVSILNCEYEQIRKYYPSHITFFSSIIEEYARLPFFKRERIYYKNIIDTLNKCNNNYLVDLILFNKDSNNKYINNKVFFKPYKIVTDKVDTFNYVVGFSKNVSSNSNLKKYDIRCFRLSRIKEVRVSDVKFKFNKSELSLLKEELSTKDVRFLSGTEFEFKVEFTNKGITLLNQILYMKPSSFIKDSENKNIYTFFCSERQLEIYLKEFGAEAKVISPLSLKNKLKDYYLKASNLYNQEDYNN